MQSRNPAARSFAERTAVNTPLQGTAADLIKLAMIRIARLLEKQKMQSRMLLQVHDELVFEAPPSETDRLQELVKNGNGTCIRVIRAFGGRYWRGTELEGCKVSEARSARGVTCASADPHYA